MRSDLRGFLVSWSPSPAEGWKIAKISNSLDSGIVTYTYSSAFQLTLLCSRSHTNRILRQLKIRKDAWDPKEPIALSD